MVVSSLGLFYIFYFIVRHSSAHAWLLAPVSAVMLVSAALLSWLRFTPAGRRRLRETARTDLVGNVVVLVWLVSLSTAAFTGVSLLLYAGGVGRFEGGELDGTASVNAFYESYAWHLADAIPLVDIPKSLNWKLSNPPVDHWQGVLIVAFQVFVLLPLIFIATKVFKILSDEDVEASAADGTESATT